MSVDRLADAINGAWLKRYGGEPVRNVDALVRRVSLLADDRDCWLANAKANQAEYLKLDARLAEFTKAGA